MFDGAAGSVSPAQDNERATVTAPMATTGEDTGRASKIFHWSRRGPSSAVWYTTTFSGCQFHFLEVKEINFWYYSTSLLVARNCHLSLTAVLVSLPYKKALNFQRD